MIKYIIRKENDILYYNNGEWVSKDKAEEFDWYNADNTARELIYDGVKVVIESKWSDESIGEMEVDFMKRYLISMKDKGFEFQTEHLINTKEFWEELSHDNYFRLGEGIYIPINERDITSISYIGEI